MQKFEEILKLLRFRSLRLCKSGIKKSSACNDRGLFNHHRVCTDRLEPQGHRRDQITQKECVITLQFNSAIGHQDRAFSGPLMYLASRIRAYPGTAVQA